ncbi:MAG: NADPH-dependent FMN reductase, partial [Pseudolabrys sp.]
MADQLNVLVICGSLRKGSYNAALTRALPDLAPPEMKLVTAPTIGTLPLYNADVQESSGFPGPAEDLAAAIRAADGVLFVTPEYNWSMPGVLKNAIDWLSR